MTDTQRLADQLDGAFASGAKNAAQPPVDRWNPPLSGDIDIRIDREGRWFHEGSEIQRHRLVKLFASILWREADNHFLVTPVEKWRIQVDEEPLLVVGAQREGAGQQSKIRFTTKTEDSFYLDLQHPLAVEHSAEGEPRPVVKVRYELLALVHRNVFYQLVEWSESDVDGRVGVWSCGDFFPLN